MKLKIFIASYILLILVMFGLPFFTAQGYSIISHTTSQLGAQKTPNSWIMNFTFALIGLTSIYAGWSHYGRYWFHKFFLVCFGISLVLASIYSHAPINPNLTFSVREDDLHSIFASTTGLSFTVLAVSTGLIKEIKSEKFLPILIGFLATGLSMLMFTVEDFMGIWQRLIFIISFGWMIVEFKGNLAGKKSYQNNPFG